MVVPFGAGGGSDLAGRAMAAGLEGVADGTRRRTWRTATAARARSATPTSSASSGDPEYAARHRDRAAGAPAEQRGGVRLHQLHADHEGGGGLHAAGRPADRAVRDLRRRRRRGQDASASSPASAGATGLDNVVFTLTEQADRDVEFDRVPFESGGELHAALLGGQIDIASLNPGEVIGQLESGDSRRCAPTPRSATTTPSSPTSRPPSEQGIDVAFAQFRGLLAPGGISDAATRYWIETGRRFAESDAYRQYVEEQLPAADHRRRRRVPGLPRAQQRRADQGAGAAMTTVTPRGCRRRPGDSEPAGPGHAAPAGASGRGGRQRRPHPARSVRRCRRRRVRGARRRRPRGAGVRPPVRRAPAGAASGRRCSWSPCAVSWPIGAAGRKSRPGPDDGHLRTDGRKQRRPPARGRCSDCRCSPWSLVPYGGLPGRLRPAGPRRLGPGRAAAGRSRRWSSRWRTVAVTYAVFGLFLDVPLPVGLLGQALGVDR